MNPPPVATVPLARHRPRGGFTLVELMATLAVASLLVALGAPPFLRTLARHAIQAQAEELQDAVRIGRDEAMKRSGPVLLCRTEATRPGHCAGTAGSWQTWLLFADVGRSGAFGAGDPVLREHTDVSARTTVSSRISAIRFESTGIAQADAGAAVIVLGPAGEAAHLSAADRALRRQVCINPRAQVAIVAGEATCP